MNNNSCWTYEKRSWGYSVGKYKESSRLWYTDSWHETEQEAIDRVEFLKKKKRFTVGHTSTLTTDMVMMLMKEGAK